MRGGWWGLMSPCFPKREPRILLQGRPGEIDSTPPLTTELEKAEEQEKVASGSFENSPVNLSFENSPVNPKVVEDFRRQGSIIVFMYSELRAATKNFRSDQIIGEGGFGIVYKGIIDENVRPGFNFTQVAVKELDPEGLQGDREWLAEVNYLGQFSHPNLVRLIGYCCENEHRLLVYEFMACGSLERHLFDRVYLPMPWSTRMKIALDAAKGLAFLHRAERPIIYRDFKTSNILLDTHYNAKLSDFGLAKEGPMGDQTHVSTRVMGTHGYAAPEYVMTGHLTARSDVYAYGVVLVEMIIGGKAMDSNRPGRQHNLVEWARPILIRNNKLPKIIDPRMDGQYSLKDAQRVASLAYQCLSQNPKERPTMGEVVEVLAALQNPSHSEDGQLPHRSIATTIHEVPEEAMDKSPVGKKHSSKPRNERDTTPNRGRFRTSNVRGIDENQNNMYHNPDTT